MSARRETIGGRALARENGQVLPLLAVGLLVVLLGISALVIDVGHAYLVKRQLQAAADSAALAGAELLPDPTGAKAEAALYGTGAGARNAQSYGVAEQIDDPSCLPTLRFCFGANGIAVHESASVQTTFARLLGIDRIDVSATATACAPCGGKPLDIALVLDRTGSMCQDDYGNDQHALGCPDLTNAKSGIQTFLQLLDPNLDRVSLVVTPPPASSSPADRCAAPGNDGYPPSSDSQYVMVPLTNQYKRSNGTLDPASPLVSTLVNCVQAGGGTAYKQALQAAHQELVNHAAPGAQKVIVFVSDGAANIAPDSEYKAGYDWNAFWHGSWGTLPVPLATTSDDVLRPCGSAVDYASSIKSDTVIYTIGYDVSGGTVESMDCMQAPHTLFWDGSQWQLPAGYRARVEQGMTAQNALRAIASDPTNYLAHPSATDLSSTYAKIAADVLHAKLVPNG